MSRALPSPRRGSSRAALALVLVVSFVLFAALVCGGGSRGPGVARVVGLAALVSAAVGTWAVAARPRSCWPRPPAVAAQKVPLSSRPGDRVAWPSRQAALLTSPTRIALPELMTDLRCHFNGCNVLGVCLTLAAVAYYVAERYQVHSIHASRAVAAAMPGFHSAAHVQGLCWSAVAILGKPAISAMRKQLAAWDDAIGHAEQVGVTSLLQGLAAAAYCTWCCQGMAWPPPALFWGAVLGSSALNAVIRTAETKAYAIGELSLCAPFLAFDPVMQLMVGGAIMPVLCYFFGWGCGESACFTARRTLAVAGIAVGMLNLSSRGGQQKISAASGFRLPRGAGLIIANCALYAFTYRLDAAAIGVASTAFYYCISRLVMAGSCLAGGVLLTARRGSAPSDDAWWCGDISSRFTPFLRPRAAVCIVAVCILDAAYMLSMFKAVSLISPVFVAAVKRGGGVLVSALFGAIFFGETLSGRVVPLLTIATAVSVLCL